MAENQLNETGPIRTTVESPESWQRVVKAEVERSLFDQEYSRRLKQAAKAHQRPGFRKGRTPKAVVEKEMGDMLRMETMEALVPKAWMAAVLEHKLAPITDPALENLEFGDEGPMRFDLVVEVRPDVELGDYEGFSVKKRAAEVSDGDVDEVLGRLRESRAVFEMVDREAGEGDQLTIDLIPGAVDGQPDEARKIEDQKFILGSPNNLPAFNEELTGSAAGQERDVTVVYPDDHPNDSLRGQTMLFHCEIKEVAAKTLPELDDEFAGAVAEGKTLEQMQQDIRADLLKDTDLRIGRELDRQILAELVRRHDVSLPPSMVQRYLESGVEELHRRNLQSGRPNSDEEDKQYLDSGRPHAENALKGMLLMEAVRQKEEIKVTDEDVDERIVEIATENGFDVDRYREFVNSGDEKERLEFDLQERRTYDLLLSRAVIEDVPADTEVFAEEES